jgi:cyclic pyranopterin phosphate synthase
MNIPGRGDLRISLTSACNLSCSYCHNEGMGMPWLTDKINIELDDIEWLLAIASKHGVKSVKLTGGEPGMSPVILPLLKKLKYFKEKYPAEYSIVTNGIPFLSSKKLTTLLNSGIDRVNLGIDSLLEDEFSKPDSPNGVSGHTLLDKLLPNLKNHGISIKINCVFTGNIPRAESVIDFMSGKEVVSIIEVDPGKNVQFNKGTRNEFINLIDYTAKKYNLKARQFRVFNETYLYKDDKLWVKFYQDHCADKDCETCRKIHFRVNSSLEATPCFLKSDKTIPLTDEKAFALAIEKNGMGPNW